MFVQIATTCDDEQVLKRIARRLVEQRLAACVQTLGPVESVYRWEGELQTSREWISLIKTREDKFDAVEQVIRSLHSYQEPEILATPVCGGSAGYLQWLGDQVDGEA